MVWTLLSLVVFLLVGGGVLGSVVCSGYCSRPCRYGCYCRTVLVSLSLLPSSLSLSLISLSFWLLWLLLLLYCCCCCCCCCCCGCCCCCCCCCCYCCCCCCCCYRCCCCCCDLLTALHQRKQRLHHRQP